MNSIEIVHEYSSFFVFHRHFASPYIIDNTLFYIN